MANYTGSLAAAQAVSTAEIGVDPLEQGVEHGQDFPAVGGI